MTDMPSSLGIEAVELVSAGARVTVRVTGRWRRRRPELRGQAMLVLEGEAGRQRFLAMPEPPSLTGAAPGTWRMSFSVPAALAPELPGRTFLQLGGVMVPLPIGDVSIADRIETPPTRPRQADEPSDADLLEARRARSSELAAESARRRATELGARVSGLERDLDDAREQSERLRVVIAERERSLRAAEQHAHAEQALRSELEQELARRTRAARHDLAALHERVADLERELIRSRRAVDEAGHLAAAAEAARAEAERRLAGQGAVPGPPAVAAGPPAVAPEPARLPDGARAELTRRELELNRAARASPPAGPPRQVAQRAGDREALALEARLLDQRRGQGDARVAILERELAAAREEAEAQRRRSARAYEAIEHVRAELREVRATASSPPPLRVSRPSGSPVQAEQLSAALARLRERGPTSARAETPAPVTPAEFTAPSGATRPWLSSVFRALTGQDASAAGRLLLSLLPAQRAADPQPVAYDLVLSDLLVAHVTVESGAVRVATDATRRPLSEVDFQLLGDLASIARLVAAGRVRRRLLRLAPRRRVARIRGERRRVAALDRLIEARLTLGELHLAGVRPDPLLAMSVAGLMIEPGWTAGERFTIAHRAPAAAAPDTHLHIRDGRPPLASREAPHGPVASVLVCPADDLLAMLAGAGGRDLEVVGEERPVMLLRQWLDRAQSG